MQMSITDITHLTFFDSFSFRLTKREKLFALLSYLKMYHLGKLLLKK